MNSADFLKLVGAPWSAYHDHPYPETAPSIAFIRTAGTEYGDDEACYIFGCTGVGSERQRASRDLITQAPRMYAYVASMATTGDTEAKLILRAIHGGAE